MAFNFPVDFLFLVSEENIDVAVFLHQHLADKDFQGFFHFLFQFDKVGIDIVDHEACDVVDIGGYLLNVFDHEQRFQYVYVEAVFLTVRVDIVVLPGPDNYAFMAVVQELVQGIIEHVERNDCSRLLIHQLHGRFLEQCNHRTFALGQMLAGSTMGADGSQHTCQQIELVRNERINGGKILVTGI